MTENEASLDGVWFGSITTLNDLALALEPIGTGWFRGHADRSWDLVPSLFRAGFEDVSSSEGSMISFFRSRAFSRRPGQCPTDQQVAEWLLLMQHYGVPTRVLDWTTTPLAALYFAVTDEKHHDVDGAFIMLHPIMLNSYSTERPFIRTVPDACVSQVANFALRKAGNPPPVVAACPPESDSRISAQSAAVTFHADETPLEHHNDRWVSRTGLQPFLRKYRIPAGSKKGLKRLVEALGVDQSTVFPDLHHLALETVRRVRRRDQQTDGSTDMMSAM